MVKPFRKGKEKKEEGTSKFDEKDQKLRKVVNPPPFNPMVWEHEKLNLK